MTAIVGILGKAGSGKDTVADFLVQHHGFVKMSLADEMKRFCKKVFDFSDQQLWGPSQFRNEVDARYADPDVWEVAEDRLYEYGRAWCAFLFGAEKASNAYHALLAWFDNLRGEYGCDWGNVNTLSPRVALQTIGTEFGRAQDEQVWVRATLEVAQRVLSGEYHYSRENGLLHITDTVEWEACGGAFVVVPAGVVVPDCRFRNEVEGVQAAGGKMLRVKRPGAEKVVVGVAGHASEAEQDTIPDEALDHVIISPEGLANLHVALTALLPPIVGGLK